MQANPLDDIEQAKRERKREYGRQYRERNREKLREQSREWNRQHYEANRETLREQAHEKRLRAAAAAKEAQLNGIRWALDRTPSPAPAPVPPQATCQACGKQVEWSGSRPRKWCSESCRVWALRHPGEIRRSERTCVICRADITALQYKAEVCSAKCRNIKDGREYRKRHMAIVRVCPVCGAEFRAASLYTKCCSNSCGQRLRAGPPPDEETLRTRARERNGRKNHKRRTKDRKRDNYTVTEIAERDKYRCGLCGRKVNMRLSGLNPKGPTIDHVIPLADGGDDTRPNVQLAHRACNVRKRTRGTQQLALVG